MELPFQEMRALKKLSQQDLADLSGVPIDIVRDIEAGIEDISLEDIERLHQTLQTFPGWESFRPRATAEPSIFSA